MTGQKLSGRSGGAPLGNPNGTDNEEFREDGMTKRFLIYGFPFFLIAIEHVLRTALHLDSRTFMGPTLAAVGVSFLLSLIVPKNRDSGLSQETLVEIKRKGIIVIPKSEQTPIDLVWVFIFALTASWAYSLYISSATPDTTWFRIPAYQVLGYGNYFIGVLFSEIKEVV